MLSGLIGLIQSYGLAGIFLSMLIENIGIPLPTEAGYLVAGHYIGNHSYSFWQMYWYIIAANMIGAMLAYGFGRQFGSLIAHRFSRKDNFVRAEEKIRNWYGSHGAITVLGTRLIGYIRPWSSIVAGLAEFSFWPFTLWTLVGTMIIVYPTIRLNGLMILVWERFPAGHLLISLALAASFFGLIIYKAVAMVWKRKA